MNLKFKAKNWDFGREEWNNYHCKFVFLCKSELLTDQWAEKKKIRELCYKGEERERAREIYGKGETKINDREDVRREKVRELTMRERLFSKKKFGKQPIENKSYFY